MQDLAGLSLLNTAAGSGSQEGFLSHGNHQRKKETEKKPSIDSKHSIVHRIHQGQEPIIVVLATKVSC